MFLNVNSLCKRSFPALMILLVGILVYANTFQVPFVLDDHITIVRDTYVHSLDNFLPGATDYKDNRPRIFSYLTFALNYHFGGLNVVGYHVVNLLIHLVAALLVYGLLRLTFRTPYFKGEAQNSISQPSVLTPQSTTLSPQSFIPLFAALLFIVHPVQIQAVTYIVQRVTSLATMFYLLSMFLYAATRWRGCRSCAPIPKMPVLILGRLVIGGMPW